MSEHETETEDDQSSDGTILDEGGIDTDERAGRSQGLDPHAEPDEDTKQEIEEEREKRLDPENRPDGAEIDNTGRTFDHEHGKFTDAEDYDENEPAPFSDPEDPNNPDNKSDSADDSADDDDSDDDSDSDSGDDAEEQR
jgi:hypothetical protein